MSLPHYPEYKGSGVRWLGEVPAHWSIVPLGALTTSIQTGPFGSQLHSEDYVPNETPVINPSNIQSGKLVADASCTVPVQIVERLSEHKLAVGDIVFARRGEMGRCAMVGPSEEGWLCGTGSLNVRLNHRALPEYVSKFLGTPYVKELLKLESVGSTMDNLNTAILSRIRVPIPSIEEQSSVAAFLDRETAKIDALIAEQEKLLALLAEKRQATISHAVTRGLNPNAPMKDSGIPWLGEVPAHWHVVMLRRVVLGFEQGWSPECEGRLAESDEWSVLKAGCVNGGQFRPEEHKALPGLLEPRPELEVRHGDVLMSRASGSPQLIGSVACVDSPPSRLMLSDKVFRLQLASDVRHKFFALAMRSVSLRAQIEQAIGGAEGLANNLPQARIKDFWIALPSLLEQSEIEGHVEQALSRFDALERQAKQSIDLLKERRSALISAAVTGKIDVRETA